MRCKFRTIACGDGLYMFPVGGSSLRSSLANGSDFFPVRQLRHEEHVDGTFPTLHGLVMRLEPELLT